MGLSDLFKSNKEKEQAKRREKRQKERQVERAIDKINDRIKDIEKERTKTWDKARTLLQNGQKSEASRLVQAYKAQGVMISRYEKQRTFAQNQLNMVSGASDMNDIVSNLNGLTMMQDFSPEQLEENLDNIDMMSDDIKDMNKIMNKAFDKDQENLIADADTESEMFVDEDLMSALENEVAVSILGDKVNEISNDKTANTTNDNINAGRDRLKELLDNK